MDTLVSPPQGMGHGERPSIHPFFQQGMKFVKLFWKTRLTNSFTDLGFRDTARHIPQNESAGALSANNTGSSNPTHLPEDLPSLAPKPEDHSTCDQDDMKNRQSSPPSAEEDPNAGRRKRRKTEKTKKIDQDAPLRAGLSGWLGKEISAPSIATPSTTSSLKISDIELPAAPVLNAPADPQPVDETTTTHIARPQEHPEHAVQSDNDRKTLKLNANGRLLSSPPPTTGQDRRRSKRGRPSKTQSKMVMIKYNSMDLGGLIDAILSGKQRHVPPTPVVSRPANIRKGPAKPTHPFFSKKTPKTQDEATSNPAQGAGEQPASSEPVLKKLVKPLFSSFASPGPKKPKFDALLHPLWPPRELVHVIDTETSQSPRPTGGIISGKDYKKSKLASISVTDEENALLSGTALARKTGLSSINANNRPALRHPSRFTASGRTIKQAVTSQLATSSTVTSAEKAPLPLISKLSAALPETYSAFDSGKHEHQLWAHKYAPSKAEDVLQSGREATILRDWLQHLKVTSVDTGKPSSETNGSQAKKDKKKKKKQRQKDGLDDFIVSSEGEASEMDNLSGSDDELAGGTTVTSRKTVIRSGDKAYCSQGEGEKIRVTNAILLSGPSGSGKTASVYAVAKELDFEVFEINSGSRRSARDMLERVGDMTQNHLVHLLNENDDQSAEPKDAPVVEYAKQNKLMGFFRAPASKASKPKGQAATPTDEPEPSTKRQREQKQSLILLEEADILFEQDKQFWTGVLTLISQSRRPIIITCNDESRIPTEGMSLHAILRFQRAPPDLAIDYLLLVAACEGHILKREALAKLYNGSGFDIRRALMDLNFWCQMAVGSAKSGLDWFLPLWPPSSNTDPNGDRMRVLSLNTYESYMGWLNRDLFLDEEPLEQETEALRNTYHWWRLGIQEIEEANGGTHASQMTSEDFATKSKLEQLDLITREAEYSEMRSSLDILCSRCPLGSSEVWMSTPTVVITR